MFSSASPCRPHTRPAGWQPLRSAACGCCRPRFRPCCPACPALNRPRYNLKRKIAGLPPVTREWYEARKAQLLASAASPVQRVWFDPLSRKKFYSENTYLAYTRCVLPCFAAGCGASLSAAAGGPGPCSARSLLRCTPARRPWPIVVSTQAPPSHAGRKNTRSWCAGAACPRPPPS